jgi:glucose-6-phosphate-specific signal transduction histidine kinase
MTTENIYLLVMSIAFAVLGIMVLLGRADLAIKRHIRESGKYNIPRLRVIYAMAFFLIGVVTTLVLCGMNEKVTLFVIVPVAIVLIALQYTWAKRKE